MCLCYGEHVMEKAGDSLSNQTPPYRTVPRVVAVKGEYGDSRGRPRPTRNKRVRERNQGTGGVDATGIGVFLVSAKQGCFGMHYSLLASSLPQAQPTVCLSSKRFPLSGGVGVDDVGRCVATTVFVRKTTASTGRTKRSPGLHNLMLMRAQIASTTSLHMKNLAIHVIVFAVNVGESNREISDAHSK
ncbi:unnamed protein product [Ectocarpus fasciculatus]